MYPVYKTFTFLEFFSQPGVFYIHTVACLLWESSNFGFISLVYIVEKPKLPEKKYYIDTNYIHLPKENMEIINPVKDGMSKYKL